MMSDATVTLAALEAAAGDGALEAACGRLGIDLVVVFGSAVDGVAPRDVDVAVGFAPGVDHDMLATIESFAKWGDGIDLLDLDRAGPVARVEALTKGRVLFERSAGDFTRREMFAVGEYLETAHLREAMLREFAR